MSTLNHPKDNDTIHSILLAQGSLDGDSLGVIARLTSFTPPHVRYAQHFQVTPAGGWIALFTGLPLGIKFLLEVFDETGQLIGSADNLEVVTFGSGTQILFPMDGQEVNNEFSTYGFSDVATDDLMCHTVEKGIDSYPGTVIPFPGMFAFNFAVPSDKVGPGWTLKIGAASDCTDSTTVNIDII